MPKPNNKKRAVTSETKGSFFRKSSTSVPSQSTQLARKKSPVIPGGMFLSEEDAQGAWEANAEEREVREKNRKSQVERQKKTLID